MKAEARDAPTAIDSGEYSGIVEALNRGDQVVLATGGAGTGKTTLIEYLNSEAGRKALPLETVVLAPTGTAAIRAGGSTIHSFFLFPLLPFDPGQRCFLGEKPQNVRILSQKKELMQKLQLLIIDEASMVRADIMDAIDASLRKNRNRHRTSFGGVQLLLVGDIFQLPPIAKKGGESHFFDEIYPQGVFFFHSRCIGQTLDQGRLSFFELKTPRRYVAHDTKGQEFFAMLGRIRIGRGSEEIEQFNQLLARPQHVERVRQRGAVILTGRNDTAKRENDSRLRALSGPSRSFTGRAEGKCADFKDDRLPAPRTLVLKEGAQVIFIKNDSGDNRRWQNGTLGTVVDLRQNPEAIRVRLRESGLEFDVTRETWAIIEHRIDDKEGKIIAESVGRYIQFPLILAWALTIHKAQGRTLDRVILNLEGGAFSAGQAYVALSRCRNAKDLALERPLRPRDVYCDERALEFYARCQALKEGAADGDSASPL